MPGTVGTWRPTSDFVQGAEAGFPGETRLNESPGAVGAPGRQGLWLGAELSPEGGIQAHQLRDRGSLGQWRGHGVVGALHAASQVLVQDEMALAKGPEAVGQMGSCQELTEGDWGGPGGSPEALASVVTLEEEEQAGAFMRCVIVMQKIIFSLSLEYM